MDSKFRAGVCLSPKVFVKYLDVPSSECKVLDDMSRHSLPQNTLDLYQKYCMSAIENRVCSKAILSLKNWGNCILHVKVSRAKHFLFSRWNSKIFNALSYNFKISKLFLSNWSVGHTLNRCQFCNYHPGCSEYRMPVLQISPYQSTTHFVW